MNKGLPVQPVLESGHTKEGMGGGDPKDGQVRCVAATGGEGVAQERGEQGSETVEKPEDPVLPESQVPSVGMEFLEVGSLNPKEDRGTPAGWASIALGMPDQPPRDWLEPLEEDEEENQDWAMDPPTTRRPINGRSQPERAVMAGKSERTVTKMGASDRLSLPRRRRRAVEADENWFDWPILGEGWKRKEVFRRSGSSVGKMDTYYMSPNGDRLRSKIEMAKHVAGTIDISMFDFKSGMFLSDGALRKMKKVTQTAREVQRRLEKRILPLDSTASPQVPKKLSWKGGVSTTEDSLASEPSFCPERTPDCSYATDAIPSTHHDPPTSAPRLEPVSPAVIVASQKNTPPRVIVTPKRGMPPRVLALSRTPYTTTPTPPHPVGVSPLRPGSPHQQTSCSPSLRLRDFSPQTVNAAVSPGQEHHFPHLSPPWLDPSLAPLSPNSSPERDYIKTSLNSSPVFQSPGAVTKRSPRPMSVNGVARTMAYTPPESRVNNCLNCGSPYSDMEYGRPSDTAFCPKCRSEEKPIKTRNIVFRKVGQGQWVLGRALESKEDGSMNHRKKAKKASQIVRKQKMSRSPKMRRRNYEAKQKQYSIPQYADPDDYSLYYDNDDMEGGTKKRNRRACWKCDACLRTTDCGRCDFCMDKPKFGGRNKKRQKCRLRQCQSQAMRHLLPFQLGQSKNMSHVGWVGRGRRSSRSAERKSRASWEDWDFTNEDDEEDEEDDEDDEDLVTAGRPAVYGLGRDDENEGDQYEAEEDCAARMSEVVSIMNFDPSNSKLNPEELYISNYPLAIQGCFKANNGTLEEVKMTEFSAGVPEPGQGTPPPEPEFLYNRPGLPALIPKDGKEGAVLGLDDEVEIVEVATGEPDEQEATPVITQIFSLADSAQANSGVDLELLKLLESLRRTVLPAHWVGLMLNGPRLQLLQCSKLSTMADTVVQIEPGFYYQISVQDQPLLLTHPLYEAHPPRLSSVAQVVALLLDLESYTVCQGYPTPLPQPDRQPVLYVRAAACELLVLQSEERCDKCGITSLVL